MPKLLMFAGSARNASTNKQLAALAASTSQKTDIDVSLIDLKDFEMPIYDDDLEGGAGLPENAKRLKQLFIEHDGLFIASPEYNSSFSPLLKNALDWISRPHAENEPSLWAYNGKVAALGAVGPGALGGLRGLFPLRMMLGNIGVMIIPKKVAISNGFSAFDEAGALNDEQQSQMLKTTMNQLISTTRAMSGSLPAEERKVA